MKMRIGLLIGSAACFWFVTACGSSSTGGGIGSANQLTGTVFAPSGTSAVAGATVYIPSASSNIAVSQSVKGTTITDAADDGTTCDNPPEDSCAATCSQADGTFSIALTGCSSSLATGKIKKGTFTGTFTISCASEGACAVAATDTKLSATSTTMAVVTGAYDNIEDVLAKLGFGELETSGSRQNHLKVGTEKFSIYTGGGSIDSVLTNTSTYKSSSTLFGDVNELKKYNIVFINCGTSETPVSSSVSSDPGVAATVAKAHTHVAKSLSASVISNLQTYVNDGGRIYVTDLAYDFVEQPFPAVADFEGGSSADSSAAETAGSAEIGTSGIVSDATIGDTTMKSWLSKQTSNTINSATSPNSGSCTTTENGSSTSLNSDGATVRVGDFLSGWAVINSTYTGSDTKKWLEGSMSFSSGSGTRPLTITKAVGSGKVLYSSYHTSHSCPTAGAWPQERVLQYLVFEVTD